MWPWPYFSSSTCTVACWYALNIFCSFSNCQSSSSQQDSKQCCCNLPLSCFKMCWLCSSEEQMAWWLCLKFWWKPLSCVSWCHIHHRIHCDSHNIEELLVPSQFIHSSLIDKTIVSIHHDPITINKTLDPDMISEISTIQCFIANGMAIETKQVGILSTLSFVSLQ